MIVPQVISLFFFFFFSSPLRHVDGVPLVDPPDLLEVALVPAQHHLGGVAEGVRAQLDHPVRHVQEAGVEGGGPNMQKGM